MAQVRESFAFEKALKVTAEGVIEGAKLVGNVSVNGRQYGDQVIAEAIGRYNGAKVYLNHPSDRTLGDRDFNDWVGVVENARAQRGGGYGDIKLRQKHARYGEICEAVEHFPRDFGLSHVADIDSEKRGAVEHVTRIGEVFSVDIVTDPATTNGIRESRTMKKQTIKQVLESTKASKSVFRKVIVEMVEGGAVPETTEVAIDPGAGEDESIKAGIMAAIAKKLESATPDELKKVLKALAIGDSVSELVAGGNGTPEPAPNAAPATPEAKAVEENRKLAAKLATMEAKTMLLESGREATAIRIKAVAAAEESDRKSLVESFPVRESASDGWQRNRSQRPESSPGVNDESAPDSDYEAKYESRLKASRERISESKRTGQPPTR